VVSSSSSDALAVVSEVALGRTQRDLATGETPGVS
jgi:hypothetical protein